MTGVTSAKSEALSCRSIFVTHKLFCLCSATDDRRYVLTRFSVEKNRSAFADKTVYDQNTVTTIS